MATVSNVTSRLVQQRALTCNFKTGSSFQHVGAVFQSSGKKFERNGGRVSCKINYLPPPTANLEYIKEIERIFHDVHENPTEGIGMTVDELTELLQQYPYEFEVGQKVVGAVMMIRANGAYIEIGAKAAAFLPLQEASLFKLQSVAHAGLHKGTVAEFEIVSAKGSIMLSLKRELAKNAWERLRQIQADNITAFATVLGINRGGLVVFAEGVRGFIPLSMLAMRTPREELVGKVIPVKVVEVDEERDRLVMNNRKALSKMTADSFKIGSVVLGTVQSVKPYGAFIDVGGTTGLLHISQISHDRVTNVETVLAAGDAVKVLVLSFDREKGRLSLSTKKLEPTPGDMIKNPSVVFEKAEEMANTFRERVAAAEAAARAEEARLQQEGFGSFANIPNNGGSWEAGDGTGLKL